MTLESVFKVNKYCVCVCVLHTEYINTNSTSKLETFRGREHILAGPHKVYYKVYAHPAVAWIKYQWYQIIKLDP